MGCCIYEGELLAMALSPGITKSKHFRHNTCMYVVIIWHITGVMCHQFYWLISCFTFPNGFHNFTRQLNMTKMCYMAVVAKAKASNAVVGNYHVYPRLYLMKESGIAT